MGATSLVTNGFKIENKQQTNDLETVDYDYLVFRERWPATTCMFPGSNVCTIAKNITTWVVHGLWYIYSQPILLIQFYNNYLRDNGFLLSILTTKSIFEPNFFR